MKRYNKGLLLAVIWPLPLLADNEITIAVASNFQTTAQEIADRFTKATDIDVRLSSGSTGKLYAQIVNGAPYDIFLAADQARPKLLLTRGEAVDDSFFIYATGRLVLWSNAKRFDGMDCESALKSGDYDYLAIANPETAPYGFAARQYLQSSGAWNLAQHRMVFGENIAQTFQFVATGNATFGFVAASQVLIDPHMATTCLVDVSDSELESHLMQAGVLLNGASNRQAAEQFLQFMQSSEIRRLIGDSGYRYREALDVSVDGEQ